MCTHRGIRSTSVLGLYTSIRTLWYLKIVFGDVYGQLCWLYLCLGPIPLPMVILNKTLREKQTLWDKMKSKYIICSKFIPYHYVTMNGKNFVSTPDSQSQNEKISKIESSIQRQQWKFSLLSKKGKAIDVKM